MKSSLIWRAVFILALVVIAVISAYPLDKKINLGLDLQGGMHLVMRVKTDQVLETETEKDQERMKAQLESEGVPGVVATRTGMTQFELRGVPADKNDVVKEQADRYLSGWEWRRTGDTLTFDMDVAYREQLKSQTVTQAQQTILNRIEEFKIKEPLVARQGFGNDSDRLVAQLPGVDDPNRVRRIMQSTAFLEFHFAHREVGPASSRDELLGTFGGALPPGYEIFEQVQRDQNQLETGRLYWPIESRRVITGRDLRDARAGQDQFGRPVVTFSLTPEGADIFGQETSANVGRNLAIILDGKVQSAPTIQSRITDNGQITGNFTNEEVEDLSLVLRSGALPAEIEFLEERTVGPSLGQDSIDKGARSLLLGSILVVASMLLVYKRSGINAIVALLLNVVFVFGGLALSSATLTLPGLAGIVLTIGMAVDANILIFERIREELHSGRTVKSAVQAGFEKALSTILDANITTLVAAAFLFQFGTGPIKGFAVTLGIGIFASVFTALFVSRFLFDLTLSRRQRVEKLSI
jgi:preprotein translocase subunit SecD